MTSEELIEKLEKDLYLKPYIAIIKEHPEHYPVIKDKNGVVLSLPPIINGNHSKMSANTKNILIECTAVDRQRAEAAVSTLVAAFSLYSKFTIETVEIEYEGEGRK